jgi:predicted TIM-barrel fold metal-dependent hydrolase
MAMQIMDADGHIEERPNDIRAFLPERYAKRAGSLMPTDGMDARMGGRVSTIEANDVPTRLRDMDREGIDVSVLFPTASFSMQQVRERDYAIAYARAYNDFIAQVCQESPRIKAIGLLPFLDVDAAVKEANRAISELPAEPDADREPASGSDVMKVAIVILNEVKDPFPTRHGFFACGLRMTKRQWSLPCELTH